MNERTNERTTNDGPQERSNGVMTNDDSVTVKSGKLLTIDILYVIIYDIADYVY